MDCFSLCFSWKVFISLLTFKDNFAQYRNLGAEVEALVLMPAKKIKLLGNIGNMSTDRPAVILHFSLFFLFQGLHEFLK
jgi:hypothetical protein